MTLDFSSPVPDSKNQRLYDILEIALFARRLPVTIGITGAGGAGKTTLADNLTKWLGQDVCTNIDLDDYLISRTNRGRLGLTGYHPQANNLRLAREHIRMLKRGDAIVKPVYDHTTGETGKTEEVEPGSVLIFEGVTTLYPQLNDLYDIAIFMDAKEETQIKSRVERDVNKRGYTLDEALTLFENLKPLYDKYIAPSRVNAHIEGIVDPDYIFSPTRVNWDHLSGRQ